ncbi:MAG: outer membrane beta-barrel protein [Gammaproteobacteria bacterium]|nr:outer membrane beta-barrel protein [Gammaproteobacteria bacterium]
MNASTTPGDGSFSDEQISGDVLHDSTIRVTYARQGSTLNSNIWGALSKLDYMESPRDSDKAIFGVDLDYPISAMLSVGVYGNYNYEKEIEINQTDKRYTIGGKLGYHLSRKLQSVLDIRYRQKDSTQSVNEYTEMSVLINLVYGFGEIHRLSRDDSF